MVRAWCFCFRGLGLIPGRGTNIPQAVLCGQKKKKKRLTEVQYVLIPTFPEVPWPWELESNGKEI